MGRPKKNAEAAVLEKPKEQEKPAPKPAELPPVEAKAAPAPVSEHQARINESRKVLAVPPSPGQKYFEAPDGMVLVGESTKDHMNYRLPSGEVQKINPYR